MDWYHPTLGYLTPDQEFTLDGVQYLQGLRSMPASERTALGFVSTSIAAKPDERYYWVTENRNGPTITYTSTPKALGQVKALRLADLAAKRYQVEVGGCTVGGMTIPTDRESTLPKLTAERIVAKENPGAYSIGWKVPGVGFITLDGPALIALADSARAHVVAAFAAEATHAAAIDALTTAEAVIAYDISTGWPACPEV